MIDLNTETIFKVCTDCYETTFGSPNEVDEAHVISEYAVMPGASYGKISHCTHKDGVAGDAERHSEECERVDFDGSPCQNCGTHLAGARYYVTTFEKYDDSKFETKPLTDPFPGAESSTPVWPQSSLGWCWWYRKLDHDYGTDPNGPLGHLTRCPIHKQGA